MLCLYTVKAGYSKIPGTFKITSLYAPCVLTEAPDITNSYHSTLLYPECEVA